MVNMTMLAPDVIATILDDTIPGYIKILELTTNPSEWWGEQIQRFNEIAGKLKR